MTSPRREVYDPSVPNFYHCISRCVRRAFLCGWDSYARKSYEHRKEWVRNLLEHLATIFAIECLAYAIMSNHLHTLLRNRPDTADNWSPEEVATRWRKLFPLRRQDDGSPEIPNEAEITAITKNPELVEEYRRRLSNLSWFNRCLNERLALRANAEDDCTGRFWEGRFKSTRLEGSAAVLACSVYIDLNPIRAGQAKTLADSDYTSIQARIRMALDLPAETGPMLLSFGELFQGNFTESQYIDLVATTAELLTQHASEVPSELASILTPLKINPRGWLLHARQHSRLFHKVMAPAVALRNIAKKQRKCWLHGTRAASLVLL